jgi:hypothetical protein
MRFETPSRPWPDGMIAPTTYAALRDRLAAMTRAGKLGAGIYYDIVAQLRAADVTYLALARAAQIPRKRFREIIEDPFHVPFSSALDCQDWIERIVAERAA